MCTTYLYITPIILVTIIITHVQSKPQNKQAVDSKQLQQSRAINHIQYVCDSSTIVDRFSYNIHDINPKIVIKYSSVQIWTDSDFRRQKFLTRDSGIQIN
jgi:hypothetical protein